MSALADIEAVLRANGITDEPEKYDSDIHSWRCSYPVQYGRCDCFGELARDLAALTPTPTPDDAEGKV